MSFESLSHTKWDCKFPWFLYKKGERRFVLKNSEISWTCFRELVQQSNSKVMEGPMVKGHVHMLIKIPPKYSVFGHVKEKSIIAAARREIGRWIERYNKKPATPALTIKHRLRHTGIFLCQELDPWEGCLIN